MQAEETRLTERGLNENAGRPNAFSKKRRRDVRSLAGSLAAVKRRHNRGIQAHSRGIVPAAGDRPRRRRAGVARHG